MAAADTAAAETWVTEDKRRMLHVVYRVGDLQVRSKANQVGGALSRTKASGEVRKGRGVCSVRLAQNRNQRKTGACANRSAWGTHR